MHKQEVRIVGKVCRESIRKWSGDARVWAIVYLVCMFAWIRVEDLRLICEEYDLGISCWYFPFQMNGIHMLFYYFGLLLLFCDAPFIDNQQMDVILRAGKRNWFLGKIWYIIVAASLYFLLVYFVGVIEFFPYVGFSPEWEDMLNLMSLHDAASSIVRRPVIASYTAIEACVIQYVVCVFFAILLGCVIFYFNLFGQKMAGLGIALSMVVTGCLLDMVDLETARFFVYFVPMTWTNIEVYVRETGGVSLLYAVSVLCIDIVVFCVLIMKKSESYNIECKGDM